MSDNQQQGIAAALVEAQRHARALFKEAENQHHKYSYASAEQVIDEARKALGGAGLAFIQVGDRLNRAEARGDGVIGTAEVSYKLVHRGGETWDFKSSMPVVVSKGRPDDKAYAAALTLTLAYTLRSLLLIPRDDQAAAIDQRDDTGFDPAEAKRKLADRYVADMAQATSLEELEELRADAKRELTSEELPRVAEEYKRRRCSLEKTTKEKPEPARQDALPERHIEAIRRIEAARSVADVDAVMREWANAPEAVRDNVYLAGFTRIFALATSAAELAAHAAAVVDADISSAARKELKSAYKARASELSGRAA